MSTTLFTSLPDHQRALVEDETGRPVLASGVALPALLPETLLVKTAAVAVNPFDHKMPTSFPSAGATVGIDFAGRIARLGAGAAALRPDLAVGDTVCGFVHGSDPAAPDCGAFAEYVRAPARLVYKVPAATRLEEAATYGCALASACLALWRCLELPASPRRPLPAGESPAHVLVYGGSTATGTMALQLLKLSGYTPIATCSPKNFPLAKSYGAEHVFDYSDPEAANGIRKLTGNKLRYALDCITDRDSVALCYAAIGRTGGRYASLELCPEELQTRKAVQARFVYALEIFGQPISLGKGYDSEGSTELHEFAVGWYQVFQGLMDDGKLRAHPVRLLEGGFEGVKEGIRLLGTGSVSGKKLVCFLE